VPALNVSQVAAVYRDLRRSLESKSDMPGAADFYYGEMEMRRWGAQRGLFERGLVWGYWLLSGYGLRAHRALFWWLMLVAIAAYFMTSGGFAFDEPSLERALVFSVRASLPGVSTVEKLTLLGQWIEIALRVFGPLMIVLFLLSVRSLVMRKPSE
jgi:hypothetical protein